MRVLDGVIAGGLIAGVIWYTRRDKSKADAAADAAERVAQLAEARAQTAATTADHEAAHAVAARARANADQAQLDSLVAARPESSGPGLTRRFDDLFARHGAGIPVAYLRALANAESGLRPDDPLGLINVVKVALADYNRRHPDARIEPAQMRDPATNIQVAADTLHQIAESYARNHGDLPNLRTRWWNPRFVELLTLGWVGGFSERAGVGRVLRHLKARPPAERPTSITIDTVFAAATAANATRHLSNPRKLRYAKGVAASFVREFERDARDRAAPPAAA